LAFGNNEIGYKKAEGNLISLRRLIFYASKSGFNQDSVIKPKKQIRTRTSQKKTSYDAGDSETSLE
jgi:hypothetical protein